MSLACSQAVGLPEIVAAILGQLHDRKALFAALQVNKLPGPYHIEDAGRLQYYADKISSLDLWCHGDEYEGHLKIGHLCFPRLGQLAVEILGYKDEQVLLQYLRPNLRTFQYDGVPISNYCLMQIQARCPVLQEFRLRGEPGAAGITANDLLRFFNGMPTLLNIHLGIGLKNFISDEVYVHLAARPNLAALQTGDEILTLSRVKTMQEIVDQPFPEMVCLQCISDGKAFSQLSRHLTRVTQLKLHLVDTTGKTVFDICSCTSLVSLSLSFERLSHFPPKGLLALAKSCSHLRDFSVVHVMRGTYDIMVITDDLIQEFVALLPELSCFRLHINTNLTHRALRIIGEGCVNLKTCSLEGESFDLQLLESNGSVLFPRLECLELEWVEDCLSADLAAKILHFHAPRVKWLEIGHSWAYDEGVYDKMQELKRQDEVQSFAQLL